MNPLLVLVGFTFAAATALSVLYTHQWLTAPSRVARRRVAPATGPGLILRSPLLNARGSRLPFVDQLPLSADARLRIESELERAGVPLRVSEFLALRVVVAFAVGGAVALFTSGLGAAGWFLVVLGAAATTAGWQLPRIWLGRKREARREAIDRRLPGALTALAKSLRAGTGLLQAIDFAASQAGEPLASEFELTLRQIRLGANPEDAFTDLSRRVGSSDLDIAVTGIVIQRNVGGNLSEILTNVSETIAQRDRFQREVAVLTSRQRLMANLIALLPVLVAVGFIGLNRELAELLFGTTAGRISLGVGITFELVGLFFVRRLARIEV